MISTTHRRPRPQLDTLRRRLDRWRDRHPRARAPLPPRLWAAAVALVPEHGLYGTARALGVSYGALKRHLERASAGTPTRVPRFVELPSAPVAGGYVIEVERAPGTLVRVHLNGLPLSDVAEFTRRVAGAAS